MCLQIYIKKQKCNTLSQFNLSLLWQHSDPNIGKTTLLTLQGLFKQNASTPLARKIGQGECSTSEHTIN